MIPGYVGARQIKWLTRIQLSERESQARFHSGVLGHRRGLGCFSSVTSVAATLCSAQCSLAPCTPRGCRLCVLPAQGPWQQKDYKLLPQGVRDHGAAEEGPHGWASMPAVGVLPVQVREGRGAAGRREQAACTPHRPQMLPCLNSRPAPSWLAQSAILTPEAGSVFPLGSTHSIKLRGYAWSGGGVPVARVDVSADGGATWHVADTVGQETRVGGATACRGVRVGAA